MLNFDPYRWNAEHDPAKARSHVSRLATLATIPAENEKSESGERPANVAKAANPLTSQPPAVVLREWHRHLAALDDLKPPPGYALNWWAQAVRDAWWIYENFASRAVRDGWSAYDLFGLLPWHPGWGGLCDRLRGARNLKMEVAGRRAVWSHGRFPDWTCAGASDALLSSGLMLIWEPGQ